MTDRDWVNPSTQDPTRADPVADGRPTPGKPRQVTDDEPGSPEWREVDRAGTGGEDSPPQERPVEGSRLDDGNREDTELGN
jgi:hypothetical protein